MATTIRPTTAALCTFTDPDTEDAGKAYSAPITTDCAAPAGLTVGDEAAPTYDDDGNPIFGDVPVDSGGGDVSSGVDVTIQSTDDLASIATTDIDIGSADAVKMWIDEATGVFQVWQLEAGTDADDPFGGVVRPDDFNAVTNAKVWYKRT